MKSWGPERDLFVVTPEEIGMLIKDGATVVVEEKDNGDGTFLSTVTFGGKTFSASYKKEAV